MESIILLVVFAGYILWMIAQARKARSNAVTDFEVEDYEIMPVWKCVIFIVGGIAAIKFGGDFVVDGAVDVAQAFGLSDTLIGLTIVAFGTSLPELATSIMAARKNEVDIAVGNVIGSNIFNILFVLGIAGAISPVEFIFSNVVDTVVLIVISAVVLLLAWRKKQLWRFEGGVMIAMYAAYIYYICTR